MIYKVGDKIRIKSYYELPKDVRSKIRPFNYVVTIRSISSSHTKLYDLKEVVNWRCPHKYILEMVEEKCYPIESRFEILDL